MKLRRRVLIALLLCLCWVPSVAVQNESERRAFVEANILSIFYHELGHALIDLLQVPIYGQEEDAADVVSVLLIDWLFEEDVAQALAYDSAFGYIDDPDQNREVHYWDVHGPDEQRFFNHVCLFYGANPDPRESLADELGLPDERAESCPEEYDQVAASWGAVFDEMQSRKTGVPMVFEPGNDPEAKVANDLLSAEVAQMNNEVSLPVELRISVESCGEANAYYDPSDVAITFCQEFIDHLEYLYNSIQSR